MKRKEYWEGVLTGLRLAEKVMDNAYHNTDFYDTIHDYQSLAEEQIKESLWRAEND